MSDNKLATKQDLKNMYDRMYPYLGGMPEMLANKFSKGDMYSTDEKMIGQWIDGKPLYQRTYEQEIVLPTNTWVASSLAATNVNKVINCIGYNAGSSIDCMLGGVVNGYFGLNSVRSDSITINAFTVQYTKTTDSPISIGDDTDYSTEEKIVGTWIDGKPLYQKTVTGITGTTGGNATVPHNIANVERIHNISGYALQNNGTNPEYTLSLNFYNGTNRFGAFADITNVYIRHVGFNSTPFVITIQYTKTTD